MPPDTTLLTDEPGDQAVQRRRHHGHLGRSAAQVAEQREAHLHHVVAAAGAVEQRAEQHEHEDEADRHAERDAEHAFGHHPHVRDHARHRGALVGDDVGQVRPGHRVDEEQHGQHRHRQADGAPRGLEQQQDADGADHDVERGRVARTQRQLLVEDDQVQRRGSAGEREQPVLPGHVIARRTLECREGEEREKEAERQVDRARLGVVEEAEPEAGGQRERDRGRVPHLEHDPHEPHRQHHLAGEARGRTAAEVGVLDQLHDVRLAELHLGGGRQFLLEFRQLSFDLLRIHSGSPSVAVGDPMKNDGRQVRDLPPVELYSPASARPLALRLLLT